MRGDLNGKFRAKVISTEDLTESGRLLCEVPDLPGMLLNWATPCVPYAGIQQGFFALPEEGSDVFIEFEGGDPDKPIWVGGYWEALEEPAVPELAPEAPELVNVLRSKETGLILNDTPVEGGVTLMAAGLVAPVPVEVKLDELGFTVNVGPAVSLSMNPETGITFRVGEVVMTMNELAVNTTAPTIEFEAEEEVNVTTSNMSVEGESVEFEASVEIAGPTTMAEEATVGGELTVAGAAEVAGEFGALGAVNVEGEANFLGATTFEGEANVLGEASFEGDANFLGAQQTEGNNATVGTNEAALFVPPFVL
jgi:hypothetical protein